MNIEQLSTDKLKVQLNSGDLDRYDLDYLSISTDSPGTKRMLRDILAQAGESTGFTTKNCKLLIEVLPAKSDGCVLYVTKLPIKSGPERKAGRSFECDPPKAANSYILSCVSIDDAISAINRFALYPDIPLIKSTLYSYEGKYHLTFSPIHFGLDGSRLVSLLADLSEYGETGNSSPVREALYAEHGSTINANHAVESFMRYFH